MKKIIPLGLTVFAVALSTACGASFAKQPQKKNQPQGFQVFDANTGDEVYNDGKMDGKACVVGTEVRYDPMTGKFKKVPAVKCNF